LKLYKEEEEENKKNELSLAARQNLERYFCLLAFNHFLYEDEEILKKGFTEYLKIREDIYILLSQWRKNEKDAFSMDKASKANLLTLKQFDENQIDKANVIFKRKGRVLSSETMLKKDHFIGCHQKQIPYIEGSLFY
jgi:hypothetical protein